MSVAIRLYGVVGVRACAELVGMRESTFKKLIAAQRRDTHPAFSADHPDHCPVVRDRWGNIRGHRDALLEWACRMGLATPVVVTQRTQENHANTDSANPSGVEVDSP